MTKRASGGDDAARDYPSSITDELWSVLEPLFPTHDPHRAGRPRVYDNRLVLNAIFYVLRTGCQWRMVPHDLAPWSTAYRWYRTWEADGTWDAVHDQPRAQVRMAAGRDPNPTAGVLDAQSVKSSEGGEARGFDAGKKTTGRKRHIVVDTLGLLLVVMVTAASVQDRAGGKAILQRLADRFPTIALVWADGGYANRVDAGLLDWARDKLRLLVAIVKRNDAVKGFQVLARRWVVERTFGWLVRNRRLARDYERLTTTSETMVKTAMIRLMATRLAGQNVAWSNATERQAHRRLTIEGRLAA
ncbi:IS5 family transposase [Geodermatophilus sp. DF01-2]|uniref:IS5 family transposase n=1 Tax=Geodermatophilus sp. DF01-2 TaxID=2559610 RepID=UPI0010741983|nr:IS5 family transposase [Geodermatophilus sp. DF01_2]TFV63632.1 IS5 family transposase [Geodermatophilus sp. DF01_2]